MSDSHLSQISIEANLEQNNLSGVTLLSPLEDLPSDTDIVVMKLPKNNRLLVWQLQQIAHFAKAGIRVIAGAKAKDIHTSTLKLFEKHLALPIPRWQRKKHG